MKTLVIAEHDNRKLAGATRHAVTAATLVGGEVDLLVAGSTAGRSLPRLPGWPA